MLWLNARLWRFRYFLACRAQPRGHDRQAIAPQSEIGAISTAAFFCRPAIDNGRERLEPGFTRGARGSEDWSGLGRDTAPSVSGVLGAWSTPLRGWLRRHSANPGAGSCAANLKSKGMPASHSDLLTLLLGERFPARSWPRVGEQCSMSRTD